MISKKINDDVSIVICGEAGQGIQTVERLLTQLLKLAGYNVFACKEYMSRVRGGSNSTEIRVSSTSRNAYVNKIDILIPLDKGAIPHLEKRITADTVIIGEKSKLNTNREIIDIPFSEIATQTGGAIYANTISVGLISGLFGVEFELIGGFLGSFFKSKSSEIIENNAKAAKRGLELAADIISKGLSINVRRSEDVKSHMLANGSDMIASGVIAGGCNFVAAYPMTPSTGIFTFLARHGAEFNVVVEQAEDEIAAVNMAIGAWYAGARGFTCTAGGGFALMSEGVSLAGMIESPLVVSVGMRPAPATGLPTRTEQSDLEHVLYSGHGEFPRIVLAPGTVESAFSISAKAFNLADKFQCPVFILSDQYLADTFYNTPVINTSNIKIERNIVSTSQDYKRYALTESGISPRGIPGYGDGFVVCDSDEHNEEGHITESTDTRNAMVEKRLKKLELIKKEIIAPELYGAKDYDTLVVTWGSNYGVLKEAIENLKNTKTAMLHFAQVYPIHPSTADFLKKAKTTVIVENNSTSQFGRLIKLHTGINIENKILKYDGMPFAVEELTARLTPLFAKEGVGGVLK